MSLTRRILDSAQSGLSKLTSLVIVDDDPLSHVDSAAFQRELAARKAFRSQRPAGEHPLVKQVLATPEARAGRAAAARDRATRVHREQKAREAKNQRVTHDHSPRASGSSRRETGDEAFRRMKEQSGRGGAGASSSASSGSAPKVRRVDAQAAEWYRTLNLAPGADMAEIKAAYRQLMRKYHPDVHAANPQKQKAANELATRVTTAYNGLSALLEKK